MNKPSDQPTAETIATDVDDGSTFQRLAFAMIADMRGGIPEKCDFCQQPFTTERYPVPEEAGEWTCRECLTRWEKAERR